MNSDSKTPTALTTWLKQKGQQGDSGFLEVSSDKDSNTNMRWLNDSLAEVIIPPYAEVLRKTNSIYFYRRTSTLRYRTEISSTKLNFDMTKEFKEIVENIKNSAVYENKQYWEERGLNQSDAEVVQILRNSTNDFLDKLSTIVNANTPKESKLTAIQNIVDDLPWDDLDTEEKEFLSEVIAPAIEAAGFDPWSII
ncbi:hypothetical protein [Cellulophaga sp. HaHa_2_1]|uniref:hypothetical protein n=1 Tax=Cellulophaga sp. HaHa_2_1 TaxID=2749994 RepID=UPI001C4EE19B|nr:hypothetical protein [Cellulophaga sp. HaHa_2_1]QXP53580.1 hypothetical protein H0I24_06515 [Cellulophaga sp. HaHa_2_1]